MGFDFRRQAPDKSLIFLNCTAAFARVCRNGNRSQESVRDLYSHELSSAENKLYLLAVGRSRIADVDVRRSLSPSTPCRLQS